MNLRLEAVAARYGLQCYSLQVALPTVGSIPKNGTCQDNSGRGAESVGRWMRGVLDVWGAGCVERLGKSVLIVAKYYIHFKIYTLMYLTFIHIFELPISKS